MATIIGIDLAWSEQRESGLCVLSVDGDGVRCERLAALCLSSEAISELVRSAPTPVVVAVDAPLITGAKRTAERELNSVFGRFKAGAYVASEAFLAGMNGLAGPETGRRLAADGFDLDPNNLGTAERIAIEVYPHPAHVVFFGLEHRLPYKKGPVKQRQAVLRQYTEHLAGYLAAHTPELVHTTDIRRHLQTDPSTLKGAALKRFEDTLDGLTCALIGLHCYRGGPAGIHIFGNGCDGYIVVPGPLPRASRRGPEGISHG